MALSERPAPRAGSIGAAYSATGGSWQDGPGRIYDRLAEDLVAACPGGVRDRRVLDLGAGTGAASRAATVAGAAAVTAVDVALGMLRHAAAHRPPAAVGDAYRLPFAGGAFDAVLAAFSLNHLDDPVAGLTEAARVLAPGGGLAATAYAADDTHPVKAAVEDACRDHGWLPEPWFEAVRAVAIPQLATVERVTAAAERAGLAGAVVHLDTRAFPELSARQLVTWRLGMAQTATFLAHLDDATRAAIAEDALARLGPDPPTLVRSFLTLTWRAP